MQLIVLPIVFGLFGAITGLTVPLLPSPGKLWPVLVHYLVFASSLGFGIFILWPYGRSRPPIGLMIAGIVALRATVSLIYPTTVGLSLTAVGASSRSILPEYFAVLGMLHGVAVLCGASLAEPQLRSPFYLLTIAIAGSLISISASIFPAPPSFRFLYVLITDGVLALLLGYFLTRIALFKKENIREPAESTLIPAKSKVICHSLSADERGYTRCRIGSGWKMKAA